MALQIIKNIRNKFAHRADYNLERDGLEDIRRAYTLIINAGGREIIEGRQAVSEEERTAMLEQHKGNPNAEVGIFKGILITYMTQFARKLKNS